MVVAVGEASKRFNGMIRLNEVGVFLWNKLLTEQTEETLTDALLAEYNVERSVAAADVARFVRSLREVGVFE